MGRDQTLARGILGLHWLLGFQILAFEKGKFVSRSSKLIALTWCAFATVTQIYIYFGSNRIKIELEKAFFFHVNIVLLKHAEYLEVVLSLVSDAVLYPRMKSILYNNLSDVLGRDPRFSYARLRSKLIKGYLVYFALYGFVQLVIDSVRHSVLYNFYGAYKVITSDLMILQICMEIHVCSLGLQGIARDLARLRARSSARPAPQLLREAILSYGKLVESVRIISTRFNLVFLFLSATTFLSIVKLSNYMVLFRYTDAELVSTPLYKHTYNAFVVRYGGDYISLSAMAGIAWILVYSCTPSLSFGVVLSVALWTLHVLLLFTLPILFAEILKAGVFQTKRLLGKISINQETEHARLLGSLRQLVCRRGLEMRGLAGALDCPFLYSVAAVAVSFSIIFIQINDTTDATS